MEAFFRTHAYLVEHTDAPIRRTLMDEIDWNDRLIGIKGSRGVGKTSFLLQYAKEKFGMNDRTCLYVNMNDFYFQGVGIYDFAAGFVREGGRVLLIDQVFKHPGWSRELRRCYDTFPTLQIVFTGSSVMHLGEDNPELNGIVRSYNLRGFSFREFLNLETKQHFRPYTLDEILQYHQTIINRQIRPAVEPQRLFNDYLHHGYYPFYREQRNYSENLLKTMNMMTEVDILLIKQIELKYLSKIKKLFYLLAVNGPQAPNISQLAQQIDTSRATVMNYIKDLSDARLINIIYPPGQQFPKKPARVMLHNTNLMYAIHPTQVSEQDIMETFFVNTVWKNHQVNKGNKPGCYIVDNQQRFRVCDTHAEGRRRISSGTLYARYGTDADDDNEIPLWLFGFLY